MNNFDLELKLCERRKMRNKPTVFLEGETDKKYFEKACSLLKKIYSTM